MIIMIMNYGYNKRKNLMQNIFANFVKNIDLCKNFKKILHKLFF